MGVQLAKALGASRVIGVCSGKNSSRVTQVGADQVIDYSKESWWENGALCRNRVDIVCDKKFFCFTTFCQMHLQVRLCGRPGYLDTQPQRPEAVG